jgi:hypothetical protein
MIAQISVCKYLPLYKMPGYDDDDDDNNNNKIFKKVSPL